MATGTKSSGALRRVVDGVGEALTVEAQLAEFLAGHEEVVLADGCQAVVRNGHLPARSVQTGVGDVEVQVPRVRDRSDSGIRFHSRLLLPYRKRARSVEELLPWLLLAPALKVS